MTSDSSESAPRGSQPNVSRNASAVLSAASLAVGAAVFSLLFLMGFFSAWLKSEGDLLALVMRGLKFGASGLLGVLCIGISARNWQRLPVPAWLPSTASFAVGFFVMSGLGEAFDGRHDSILSKAGGGLLSGAMAGFGIYWVEKKGWLKKPLFGSPPRSIPGQANKDSQQSIETED
jgi:hypothetical protein